MPKFTTSAGRATHPDGKKTKKPKYCGHQYRDAVKARKLRKTRVKGIVEEVVENFEPGKAKPLRRAPKYDFAKIERRIRASCEETQPVDIPVIPAEVYGADLVNYTVPQVIVPISEATAKRKQEAAGEDDGNATDVDESEDNVVVPAGFVEAAEKLGLLSVPTAPSGPLEEFELFEEPPSTSHAQPDKKPPTGERPSTEIKTPSLKAPQTISSEPSPLSSSQPSHLVPEPVLVEALHNASQTNAATSSPTYPEPSVPISVPISAPISVPIFLPQAPAIPESFQEASLSSTSHNQNSTTWDNNRDDVHFHQQGTSNVCYLDSDVNMESSDAFMMETPVYSLPTMWIPSQLQPEHQMFHLDVGQVADNNSCYQTYTMDNIQPGWASMQFQLAQTHEHVQQSAHTHKLPFNHVAGSLTAATHFWTALSGSPGTSQSPTADMKIIKSTPTQVDEPEPREEPTKLSSLIRQDSNHRIRRRRIQCVQRGVHPFPSLRGYKDMRLINMSGELEEPHVVLPTPDRRRHPAEPPVGSEMDLINRLRMEAEDHTAPRMSKMKHKKRRREDFQPDFSHTSNPDIELPPRQRRRCEPESEISVPVPKRSRKPQQRFEASLKRPRPTSSRTPTGWNFSRIYSPISSLADRLFKFL